MSLPVDHVFSATAATNQLSVPGHGLVENQRIRLLGKSILPAPLVQGRDYWIIEAVGDDLRISTERGGSQVDITEDGEGAVYVCRS